MNGLETKPRAGKGERDRDDEPDADDDEHGGKRNRARGLLGPKEQVQEEEGGKYDTGDKQRGKSNVNPPLLATHGLVSSGRNVSSNDSEDGIKNDGEAAQRAAIRRREETKQSKQNGEPSHDKQLCSVAQEHREEQRTGGRSEHVAMDQLPSRVLLNSIFQYRSATQVVQIDLVQAIVSRNILLQRSDQNGHDGKHKDDDNNGRIDEPEPVDLGVKDVQVLVPSGGPGSGRLDPVDAVAKLNILWPAAVSKDERLVVVAAIGISLVLFGAGLDNNADNSKLVRVLIDLVVLDPDLVVVVEDDVACVVVLSQQESRAVKGRPRELVLDLLAGREAVHKPIQAVSLLDPRRDKLDRLFLIFHRAQRLARLVPGHLEFERRSHDPVAKQDAPQALRDIFRAALWLAELEGRMVVVVGHDRV